MRAHLPFTDDEIAWREEHMEPPARISAAQRERLLGEVVGDFPVHGFDISSYQPAGPDFRAGGRSFGIFKATEGTGYFDPHFNANRAAAHGEGCRGVGLYHFARPGSHSPDAEASYFLNHVGGRQPNEFAVLDYEVPPWSESWIVRYVQLLEGAGWRVAFYSYAGMISANPTGQIVGATPHLWIAAYSRTAPSSDRWPHWTLWQHTDGQSSVGGNDGPWDCSVAVPNLLDELAQSGGPPPPPPTTQEEPVGAFALPVLEPGETYTFRPPPADGSGGIHFGAVFFSFGIDFVPDPGVPLRIAIYNGKNKAWEVPFGGGSFDAKGVWHNDSDAVPPLWITSAGDVAAVKMTGDHTKVSIVHCGKAGRIVPLVEYQT